jgi:cytochrome c oxidase subunit I
MGLVAGTDHKRVALRVAVTAFAFFVVAGLMAVVMRTELAAPGLQVVSERAYNQLFSMHGSAMVYLFVTPMAIALGLYLVPLQIGASDIAAPRAALLGFWLFLGGGLIMFSGFLTQTGAGSAGWTAYAPLSDSTYTPGSGMDMWVFGVGLSTLGELLLAACVLATVVRRRAPGMTMLRIPVFSWTMVVTCLMVVTAFPALLVTMALLYVERTFGGIFGGPDGPITYQHLFWFYGHPVVYVMFFPFVGAVAEVVAVFSRKRFFGYRALVLTLLAFTALSMAVWAHHMFTTGQVTNQYYALTSTALIVPAGIEYFDLIATMVGGSILLRTPMLFAIGFILQFLIGGVTGVFTGSPPLDYHAHDTYFVVAHMHYVLFAGSVFGFFAGVYYWFPKVTGALLREGLGKIHFLLMVVGTNLTFLPMHFLGLDGMARRIADYPEATGWGDLNLLESVGAYILAVSIAVFLVNVVISLRRREPAGIDPWGGHTLEWATTSPPPRHNFDFLPPVRSYAPVFDLRHGAPGGESEATVGEPAPRASGA